MFVLHRCDYPRCVNIDHLFLGTHADNMADMTAKRRRHGERNPSAKITQEIADRIRVRHAESGLPCYKIAPEFGLGRSQIWNIIAGRSWV
jgi:HNH endonuclease